MNTTAADRANTARELLGSIPDQLAALQEMPVSVLRERWLTLFGVEARSRNVVYLRRRLAYRLQELAEQRTLSPAALERIAEVNRRESAPVKVTATQRREPAAGPSTPPSRPARAASRDPRLPAVGTVIKRSYRGVRHEVVVTEQGFDLAGQVFSSLSAAARAVSGMRWNGYNFWGLDDSLSEREEPRA